MERVALWYSYGCDPEDAQDAVQEAMVKVLAGDVDLLNGQGTPWGRLLGTTRNVARNRNRKEEVRETEPIDETWASREWVKSGRKLGTWIVERLALRRALEAALEGLTPNEREVVVLLHVEGWTPREVAEHRECSADAVRKLSRTALAKLAEELEERFGPE